MALIWVDVFLMTCLLITTSESAYNEGILLGETEHTFVEVSSNIETCAFKCECYDLVVNCSFKNLNVIPVNLDPSIVHLNLVGNSLSKLSYNGSLKGLNILNVSQNNVSQIDEEWIQSLKNLKYLDVSKNSLTSKEVENKLKNISMVHLNLSINNLTYLNNEMFLNLFSLQSLNLSFNAIENSTYNCFWDLHKLNTLDLSVNYLTDIPYEWFKNSINLRELYLKQNNIRSLKSVVFATLKNLQILDLSDNHIESIGILSFKGLGMLKTLNISKNSLSQLHEGVFRSLESLEILDASQNPIFNMDNSLAQLRKLKKLYLRNLSEFKEVTQLSLVGAQKLSVLDFSGSKSLSDLNTKAFYKVSDLKILDLSACNLTSIKMGTFNPLSQLDTIKLSGNMWQCDCYMHWFLSWLVDHSNTHLLATSETFCASPLNLNGEGLLDALDHNIVCSNASIHISSNLTKFKVGASALLKCDVKGNPLPTLTWITPQKHAFQWSGAKLQSESNLSSTNADRLYVTDNGNLGIRSVERGDGGFYVCIASNPLSYDSISIQLTLDYDYLIQIKIISVLVGMATSFGFLLLTLIVVLIKMIFKHFGVKCPCRNGNASPRTQQIKKILESMEHYKKQQLDRLRDNYNFQVQKIKDNCMSQMERLRESYSSQAERLRDIKEYGNLQIDRIRENYTSQVQRVRDYSTSQIIRLRENYLFQRNRIRKFSANHLYKLRENYKVQQQNFNKILENFNIESCRNVCQRTDSVIFEPDVTLDNVLVPKICLQTIKKEACDSYDNSSQLSAYFTPDDAGSEISGPDSDEPASILTTEADILLNNPQEKNSFHDLTTKEVDCLLNPSNETIV